MEFRNIHFAAPAEQQPEPEPTVEAVAAALPEKMRLRKVAVSPLEEYQLREGKVRPISDALAACILSFKGRAEVSAKGITIKRKELGERTYFHADSRICSDHSAREKKWFYFINRLKPDRIHLFDEEGRYIETLPEKFMPAALDLEAQAKAIAEDKRAINRAAQHLQRIHGEDTWQKLEEMRHNREITTRYVQTLEAAGVDRLPAAEAPAGGTAERIALADRNIDRAKGRHASAVDLGRALAASRSIPAAEDLTPAEDWSDLPANRLSPDRHTQPTTTHYESW